MTQQITIFFNPETKRCTIFKGDKFRIITGKEGEDFYNEVGEKFKTTDTKTKAGK